MSHTSLKIALPVLCAVLLAGCKARQYNNEEDGSGTAAYGNQKIHIVVAAKPSSCLQGLWICQNNAPAPGSSRDGYYVSIGYGTNGEGTDNTVTPEERGENGSNLTPVGRFRVGEMIGSTCAEGMTERCIQLIGEDAHNRNTVARSIFIHGTTPAGEQHLGQSASHGCVRMSREDIKKVYNYVLTDSDRRRIDGVNTGTKVYIMSQEIPLGQHPCARQDLEADITPE